MRRFLMRCRLVYQQRRAEARMESLRAEFSRLEAACFAAGEDELSSMIGLIWSARRKGEQHEALLSLMFRTYKHWGPFERPKAEPARVDMPRRDRVDHG